LGFDVRKALVLKAWGKTVTAPIGSAATLAGLATPNLTDGNWCGRLQGLSGHVSPPPPPLALPQPTLPSHPLSPDDEWSRVHVPRAVLSLP
jgi:hypothetical protein